MIAFVFPGQGSQFVGMGWDIHQRFPEAREVFEEAQDALGENLADLCFKGPEEELTRTVNSQPAILTVSVALYRVLAANGLHPHVVAGLSLGEYSAHVAAGTFSFAEGVRLVRKRGQYMQEAVPVGQGSMAAIIGLSPEKVRQVCDEASSDGVVEPANYNSPGQIIVSGQVSAVQRAVALARSLGASTIPLKVSAPFHSTLMKPAGARLKQALDEVSLCPPRIPVVANSTADYVTSIEDVRTTLVNQVWSPVLWDASVRKMIQDGVKTFIEVGPGRTLTSMIRKIDRGVAAFSVEDIGSLESVLRRKEEICHA